MNLVRQPVQLLVGGLLRLGVGFFFARIECFHRERVPLRGPVLFAANHPNSIADAFLLGTHLGRVVHFVATVELFRFRALAWLLRQCGIIPVNRLKDDPRGMRTVRETFDACFTVLEAGGAVGIFPEGITYDDSQLKEIKSGAARLALELEEKHQGRLGLVIVPIGLTYAAKERYRSAVLVNVGEPVVVSHFLPAAPEGRREQIRRLSAELEARLKSLIVTLPDLETARVVEAVQRLYLEELRVTNTVIRDAVPEEAERVLLLQSVAEVVADVRREDPARYARFLRGLEAYEKRLERLRLTDDTLAEMASRSGALALLLRDALLGGVLLPLAVYGWVHRLIPVLLVAEARRRFTRPGTRRAQASSASIVAGALVFTAAYACYVGLCAWGWGWRVAGWYALSLPVSGLVAHHYWTHAVRFFQALRQALLLLRAPFSTRRALVLRRRLRSEIEAARGRYRPVQRGGGTEPSAPPA